MVVLGIGLGLFYSSATTAGVTAVGPERTASRRPRLHVPDRRRIGGAGPDHRGVHVGDPHEPGRRRGSGRAGSLTERDPRDPRGTDSAKQALADFSSKATDQVLQIRARAFAAGFHSALLLDAALASVGFLIALFFVGGRLRLRRRATAAEPGAAPESEPA